MARRARTPVSPENPAPRHRVYGGVNRFDPGATAKGTLPGWVIGLTIAGRSRYATTPQMHTEPGDVLLVRPGVPQSWTALEPHWHVAYAVFDARPTWHGYLNYPQVVPGYSLLRLRDPRAIRRVHRGLVRVVRLLASSLPEREEFALCALEEVLLWIHSDQARQSSPFDPRVAQAIEHLTAHLAQPITLDRLAKACHASRSQLAHLFERQVGTPPMRFLEHQRLQRAMQMLRMSNEPIKAIALGVGYDEPKYFSKRFKRYAGVMPREYRARAQAR
jgi:AraC family transcriptional regulator, arabinose operon regulatory protein